jgi:hypothetical protein
VKRAYWLGFGAYLAAIYARLGVGLCATLLVVWATLRYGDHPATTSHTIQPQLGEPHVP